MNVRNFRQTIQQTYLYLSRTHSTLFSGLLKLKSKLKTGADDLSHRNDDEDARDDDSTAAHENLVRVQVWQHAVIATLTIMQT